MCSKCLKCSRLETAVFDSRGENPLEQIEELSILDKLANKLLERASVTDSNDKEGS